MPTDELRGELTMLADEVEPFTGDVQAVHRRVRSRRIITAALVAAALVVVVASTVAVAGHRDAGKVDVTGTGSKDVSLALITHVDAIVVPATPEVQDVLDASPFVAEYARIPRADRSSDSLLLRPKDAVCALQQRDGYAVVAKSDPSALTAHLTLALTGRATVYDVSDQYGSDIEFFMKVDASRAQTDSLRNALAADGDVSSFVHLSRNDAYAIFKKDFADQPALVASTKPSDLPESFRVILEPGRSIAAVVHRYANAAGLDTTITANGEARFHPGLMPASSGPAVSPCSKR